MTLGFTSDTEDIWGNLTETGYHCDEEALRNAILSFVGSYNQIPPMYSAKKVNGEKLCNLARRGITVERKPEHVEIFSIEDISISLPKATFTVRCSKGTYIRTLITDIAKSISENAVMSGLKRVQHGIFTLSEAHSLDEIKNAENSEILASYVLPVDSLLKEYPAVTVYSDNEFRLKNGNILTDVTGVDALTSGSLVRIYDSMGNFTALYRKEEDGLHAYKMFL